MFGCLDGHVPEEELDLIQFAACEDINQYAAVM